MYPHRIRLRGFWDPVAPVPEEAPLLFPGKQSFRRFFGWPTRLDLHERVWLTFSGSEASTEVWLNGQCLGCLENVPTSGFEITPLLQIRNELRLVGKEPSAITKGMADVALEVRCSAFLQRVRFWITSDGKNSWLHAAGEVAGTCDQPLELYLLLDQATVAYSQLGPITQAASFHLFSEGLPQEFRQIAPPESNPRHLVRLDLVAGATIWYTLEQPLSKK